MKIWGAPGCAWRGGGGEARCYERKKVTKCTQKMIEILHGYAYGAPKVVVSHVMRKIRYGATAQRPETRWKIMGVAHWTTF